MMNRKHIVLGLTAILLAGATAMPATAATTTLKDNSFSSTSHFTAALDQDVQQLAQRKISASEAKSIARRRAGGGEVVDISRNGNTYRVRVIRKDGRVVDVLIDATTGRVK